MPLSAYARVVLTPAARPFLAPEGGGQLPPRSVTRKGTFRFPRFHLSTIMDTEHSVDQDNSKSEATPKVYTLVQEAPDTEFRKEFPPDPQIGAEFAAGARVWRVYRKEADAYDNALLEGWSATLEGLLIFAGLFSAVVTAFVIESYQLLQLDNSAYTARAMYILVAASNNPTGISLPAPPDLAFSSSASRWINGLFFTSILLSLVVAFLSILVKQWITEYRSRNRASAKSPREWAHRREVYSRALERWPVAEIVSFLPVLLHVALFLFFAGLVAFLWALDQSIGIWIIVLGLVLFVFYLGCTFVPLWVPKCPTATPLVHQMRRLSLSLVVLCLRAFVQVAAFTRRFGLFIQEHIHRIHDSRIAATFGIRPRTDAFAVEEPSRRELSRRELARRDLSRARHVGDWNADSLDFVTSPSRTSTRSGLEALLEEVIKYFDALRREKTEISLPAEDLRDDLDASALTWLMFDVSDSDAVAVGFQALGGIHPQSGLANRFRIMFDDGPFFFREFKLSEESMFTRSTAGRSTAEVIRVARSALLCQWERYGDLQRRVPSLYTLRDVDYPDLAVLQSCTDIRRGLTLTEAWGYHDTSPSLSSTALLVLGDTYHPRSSSLPYLLCGDFTLFSNLEWDYAFRCITAGVNIGDKWIAVLASQDIYKPLCAAALLKEYFTAEDTHAVDCFVLRFIRVHYFAPHDSDDFQLSGRRPSRSDEYKFPPLESSMLDFLTSDGFARAYRKQQDPLKALAVWLCSDQGAIHVSPDSVTQPKFWCALSHAANAAALPHAANSAALHDFADAHREISLFCRMRLVHSCESGVGLSAVLDGILLPCTPLEKSLWALLCQGRQKTSFTDSVYESWHMLAQRLAAALCVQGRRHARGEAVEEMTTHTREFFAELEPLYVQGSYRGFLDTFINAAARPSSHIILEHTITGERFTNRYLHMSRRDDIAHLVHHCRELNPSWSPESFQYPNGAEEERLSMVALYSEPGSKGPCQWCPAEESLRHLQDYINSRRT